MEFRLLPSLCHFPKIKRRFNYGKYFALFAVGVSRRKSLRAHRHWWRGNHCSGAGPFFGMSQHQAQGTTLALLVPPVGLLAALTYYKQGYVDLKIAAFICIGFFLGGFLGAKLAIGLSNVILEKVFGVALLLIAVKMIFFK